jgi:hypothetical protein
MITVTCEKYSVSSMPLKTCILRQTKVFKPGSRTGTFPECKPKFCTQAKKHMAIFLKSKEGI